MFYLNNSNYIGVYPGSINNTAASCLSPSIKIKGDAIYSLSMQVWAESNTKGAQITIIGSTDDRFDYDFIHECGWKNNGDSATLQTCFYVPGNINYLWIRILNGGIKSEAEQYQRVVFFHSLMLVEGQDLYPKWYPAPNNVTNGITTISKDGIIVQANNINGYSKMSANGFRVNKDGEDIFKVNYEGLYIKGKGEFTGKLTSDEVIMANGGLYTGQSVRGRNLDGFTLVGTYGQVALRAEEGHVYLQPNSNCEVKVTAPSEPDNYKNLRAWHLIANDRVFANGVALTSNRNAKKNIEDYTESALHEICTTPIRKYHLKTDLDNELKRIGIIVQEAPLNAIDLKGECIDLYQMVSMSWKAIQELKEENNNLKLELEDIKKVVK